MESSLLVIYWFCKECHREVDLAIPPDLIGKLLETWNIPEKHKELIKNNLCPNCYPLYELIPSEN